MNTTKDITNSEEIEVSLRGFDLLKDGKEAVKLLNDKSRLVTS